LEHQEPQEGLTFSLQILATTDLHMRLLPFDYLRDVPSHSGDLATLATVIEALRADHPNTLLVDNGDFLQGTPMADVAAENAQTLHPAISAMNQAGYDAAGVGNHELDYGLSILSAAMSQANFPILSVNLRLTDPAHGCLPNLRQEIVLEREFQGPAKNRVPLRVGVLGLTPPGAGTAEIEIDDMVTAAKAALGRLRKASADIVLALCLSGISTTGTSGQDHLLRIAAIEGIDAVIGGHTHQPFPGPQTVSLPGIDASTGHIFGKPVVAPGAFGSQLGRIVLGLRQEHGDWRIETSKVDLLSPKVSETTAHPAIVRALDIPHRATRHVCDQIVGTSLAPLQSLTPVLGPDPCLALLARAQARSVAARLAGSPWAELPLLSAVSPRQSLIAFPAGEICRRQIYELAPFPDHCDAIIATGAQLRQWLTRSASVFLPVRSGGHLQPLIDPAKPPYTFDILYGLTYGIDLRPGKPRITDLCHRGVEVADDDSFVVALSSHRLGDGGLDLLAGCPVVCKNGDLLSTAIQHYLRNGPITAENPPVSRFVPQANTSIWIDADKAIMPYLAKDSSLRPIGQARNGLQRFEVDLSERLRCAPAAN
jgi:2',3'-cyclic-nucleotide 2'-phosphodiesterase/3'-nucleotidase